MDVESVFHKEILDYFSSKAPILCLTVSRSGKIQQTNGYVEEVTGKQLTGHDLTDLLVEFSPNPDLAALANSSKSDHLLHVNTADGLPRSYYFTIKRVKDVFLLLGRPDIEDSESLKTDILTLNRDLNNLTRQLHKKNALLEELNQEKTRFLGIAAHDLRNPIGLVVNYADFLIDEIGPTLTSEHLDFLKTINVSCSHMARIVDDFLSSSLIDAGKFTMNMQPASLHEITQSCKQTCGPPATRKNIDIVLRNIDPQLKVVLDVSKFEQAVTNLLSNAIEYSAPNSTVVLEAAWDSDYIYLTVEDHGQGIPADKLDQIFDPYETTGQHHHAGAQKHAGLGLYIARKIIIAHGGDITVKSKVGEGTAFRIMLPLPGDVHAP